MWQTGFSQRTGWAVAMHGGAIADISSSFPEAGFNYQLDAAAVFRLNGSKYWHRAYHLPEIHVRGIFADYGNPDIIGYSASVLAEIHNNREIGKNWGWNWNLGYGLSWYNNPHDALENPENLVIGSRITTKFSVGGGFGYDLGKTEIGLFGTFRHTSNGHFRVPNIGANVFLVGLQLKYTPEIRPQIPDTVVVNKKLRIEAGYGVGLHEIEGTTFPADGPLYQVHYARLQMSKRLSAKSSVHGGFSFNVSEAATRQILNENLFDGNPSGNNLKVISYIGHEFHFGHFGGYIDLGYNLYDPFRKEMLRRGLVLDSFMDTHFSNEVGFRFYLKDPVTKPRINGALNLGLRTIWGKADFFTAGINLLL